METNVKIVGFANESFNGKTLSSKGFDVNYDGNIADINAFSNGNVYYTRLDNEDIQNLLSIPSSSQCLEERLGLSTNQHINPIGIKYKIIRHKSKSSRKMIKRNKGRTSSKSYSRGRSTRRLRIKERKPTPYKSRTSISHIPSIDRTIY